MKIYTIENETNNIIVHGSVQEAGAVTNAEPFRNEAALAKLAADWPMGRLVGIWNSIPGVAPVSKFKDRATGVSRIWKAIQTLGGAPEEPTQAEAEPEPKVADVAPQAPDVAPAESSPENEATPPETPAETAPIETEKCTELLKIVAAAQGDYWDALRNLEEAIGFEIDDPGDLSETTVAALIEVHAARRKPKTRTKTAARENSKTSQVIAMLRREQGASLEEIMTAMQWQKHTTRAMLSAGGSLVKKHGLNVTSEKVGEKRVYTIKP